MVIFHSYVKLPEGIQIVTSRSSGGGDIAVPTVGAGAESKDWPWHSSRIRNPSAGRQREHMKTLPSGKLT
jgi:hypothetical protein